MPDKHLINDAQMRLLRALPREQTNAIGPFVFVDHYRHTGRRGIGDRLLQVTAARDAAGQGQPRGSRRVAGSRG